MRKATWLLTILFMTAALTLAGCATIASGTRQSLSVTSNVDGAEVYLDGQKVGTTPFIGVVKKNGKMLRIEKEGYRSETVVLSKSLESIFWGNIIIGGTLGSITDFASGAAYSYAPATYQVDLRSMNQALTDFQHELIVRKFAMIYIDEISCDVSSGVGDYAASLLNMINNGEQGPASFDTLRQALMNSGGDPVRFGNIVVSLI